MFAISIIIDQIEEFPSDQSLLKWGAVALIGISDAVFIRFALAAEKDLDTPLTLSDELVPDASYQEKVEWMLANPISARPYDNSDGRWL